MATRMAKKGFTLVELLTVVALIAILAAMLFPVFARVRDRARQTVCLAHLRQMGQAYLMYLQDWDEQLAPWRIDGPAYSTTSFCYWTEYLQPYLKDDSILWDPAAVADGSLSPKRKADYALLTWGPGGRGTEGDPHWRWPGPPFSLAEVARPSETFQWTDGVTLPETSGARVGRHRGGTNLVFVDGHARWISAAALGRVSTDGRGYHWMHYATADR